MSTMDPKLVELCQRIRALANDFVYSQAAFESTQAVKQNMAKSGLFPLPPGSPLAFSNAEQEYRTKNESALSQLKICFSQCFNLSNALKQRIFDDIIEIAYKYNIEIPESILARQHAKQIPSQMEPLPTLAAARGVPMTAPPLVRSAASVSESPGEQRTALLLVAVVTERKALLEELRAQQIVFSEDEIDGRYVHRFSLPGRSQPWQVVVGQGTEKGPHAANSLTQHLVRKLSPTLLLFVGMCGGLSERDATEQSVIVARQVFNYEAARIRAGKGTWALTAYRSSPRITDLINSIAAGDESLSDINIIVNKDYGSGEKLIDDLNSPLRNDLIALSGDLVGFEQEGHGTLHALWELQRENSNIHACVIKGVSDFGDGLMRENKKERQHAATRRAVRLALAALRRY